MGHLCVGRLGVRSVGGRVADLTLWAQDGWWWMFRLMPVASLDQSGNYVLY